MTWLLFIVMLVSISGLAYLMFRIGYDFGRLDGKAEAREWATGYVQRANQIVIDAIAAVEGVRDMGWEGELRKLGLLKEDE
jgi:hypothetical protein